MDFIKSIAKAITAFVVGAVLAYFAKKGLVVDTGTQTYLMAGLEGLIVAVAVYIIPNQAK